MASKKKLPPPTKGLPMSEETKPKKVALPSSNSVNEAVAISSVGTIATGTGFSLGMLFQHQSGHAHRLDMQAEACLGKIMKDFAKENVTEAVATTKLFRGEADSSIGSTLAALSAGQMAIKTAQSTPGDMSLEIAKLGGSVASLQASISDLVAILQVTFK